MTPIQLWTQNRPLARKVAGRFFLPGSEREDVQQEALIGLWEAAQSFRDDQGCSFKVFADMVIQRHLADCVRSANAGKARPLNESSRDEMTLERLPHWHQVSERCESREEIRLLLAAVRCLSAWERHCVVGIASGLSYAEIGGDRKRIDNTLYKARKRLREEMAC